MVGQNLGWLASDFDRGENDLERAFGFQPSDNIQMQDRRAIRDSWQASLDEGTEAKTCTDLW